MNKVYIVEGRTGSYSDRSSWYVCCFLKKKEAVNFAKKCEKESKKIFLLYEGKTWEYDANKHPNKYDYKMQMIDTYASYEVAEVPLVAANKGKKK